MGLKIAASLKNVAIARNPSVRKNTANASIQECHALMLVNV